MRGSRNAAEIEFLEDGSDDDYERYTGLVSPKRQDLHLRERFGPTQLQFYNAITGIEGYHNTHIKQLGEDTTPRQKCHIVIGCTRSLFLQPSQAMLNDLKALTSFKVLILEIWVFVARIVDLPIPRSEKRRQKTLDELQPVMEETMGPASVDLLENQFACGVRLEFRPRK